MHWTSITSYWDKETGEALTKNRVEKGNYVIIKTVTKHQLKNKDYGTRYIQHICEKSRQTELW